LSLLALPGGLDIVSLLLLPVLLLLRLLLLLPGAIRGGLRRDLGRMDGRLDSRAGSLVRGGRCRSRGLGLSRDRLRSAKDWVRNAHQDGTYELEWLVEKGVVHGERGHLDVPIGWRWMSRWWFRYAGEVVT
jgi:hypothetical protein